MKQLYVNSAEEWRLWLQQNHDREKEIWLLFYKKEAKKISIDYEAAVEEALCYGWIDSIIKKIDDEKYARKSTPRKESSKWSESNKKRIAKLLKEKRITKFGFKKVTAAKKAGIWNKNPKPEIPNDIPIELEQALNKNNKAKNHFESLSPSHRKQYVAWIFMAKRSETKLKRVKETINLLAKGQKLGLK